jgi:hypothetical protein
MRNNNNFIAGSILAVSTALFSALAIATPGPFGFDDWMITSPGPSAPLEVEILGSAEFDGSILTIGSPDCATESECSGPLYEFAYTSVIDEDAFLSFDFIFDTFDKDGPFFDRLGVWRNDEFFQLIDAFLPLGDGPRANGMAPGAIIDPNHQIGSAGINVEAGDVFGFGLTSEDSCCGPSIPVLSNFNIGAFGSEQDGAFFP